MKRRVALALCMISAPLWAQTAGLKPGLWEVKTLKQVMDGQDRSAQMAAAQDRMQQAMASLTPEQRAQMQAFAGKSGMPGMGAAGATGGGLRICISPEMAARNKPLVDPNGRCEPATMDRSGNTTRFSVKCNDNGRSMVGQGESTNFGDRIATRMDITVSGTGGDHHMQSETEMSYLGSDCQGVAPLAVPGAARQ